MTLNPAQKRISRIALIVMFVAQWAPSSLTTGSVARQSARATQPGCFSILPVLGDFDGDRILDQAELHLAGAHRCIRVRFGESRESHLELRATAQVRGALLTRDINRDNKPDLIYIYQSQSEEPEAWLGDGLGHFDKAEDKNAGAGLRLLLPGDSNPGLFGDVKDERFFLTPEPVSPDLTRRADFDDEISTGPLISWRIDHRELAVCLSCLRERGPPLHAYSF
jgi:hypothetical protein